MRMKDSDDYITARAANPLTGLITPFTPDSPGEALARDRPSAQDSPTPANKSRPLLTKANESRKISSGSAASNKIHGIEEAGPPKPQLPGLGEDRFVVHMPSAREPQPFAYPGYTPEQIEALQHYRHKTRRVSSEGYDRRLLRARSGEVNEEWMQPPHDRAFTAYGKIPGQFLCEDGIPPDIIVRKRTRPDSAAGRNYACISVEHDKTGQRSDARANEIRHLTSPTVHTSTHEHVKPPNGVSQASTQGGDCWATVMSGKNRSRKLCRNHNVLKPNSKHSAPGLNSLPITCYGDQGVGSRRSTSCPRQRNENDQEERVAATTGSDLRALPKVRLVKPEQAAIPVGERREVLNGKRQCSLGCRIEGEGGHCVERKRLVSDETVVIHHNGSVLATSASKAPRSMPNDRNGSEVLTRYLMALLTYLGSLQLPRFDLIELLKDPGVPIQEKTAALKAVLSLAGHALAICTLLAMLWKLGVAVMGLLEVVLWPFVVPMKMVKWVVLR